MANDENLIPLNKRTKREQREIRSKAGKASGASRRKKKAIMELTKGFLKSPATLERAKNFIAESGIDDDTNAAALVASTFMEALAGNVSATKMILEIVGETAKEKRADKQDKRDKKHLEMEVEEFKAKQYNADEDMEDDGFLEALGSSSKEDWEDEENN